MIVKKSYKDIGIKLSGGADSSIVYYMLCDAVKDRLDVNVYALTLSTSSKPYYIDYAKRVISVVGKLTGVYPVRHFTRFVDHWDWSDTGPYDRGQEDLVKEVQSQLKLDIIYSGLTQNPDPVDMEQHLLDNLETYNLDKVSVLEHLGTRDRSRDPENFNLSDHYLDNKPFITGDKKMSAAAYRDYGMMDKLYPHTFSCEGIVDYKGIDVTEHCGTCFFCLERYYAFGRLV